MFHKKKVYCPWCNKQVGFIIKKEQKHVVVLGTPLDLKIRNPYCKECGALLDVPWVERINSRKLKKMYNKKIKEKKNDKKDRNSK